MLETVFRIRWVSGSGSADPYHGFTNPDLDPDPHLDPVSDPALSVNDLQDADKDSFFF
jgi:hypothetical protein